jgi:hypothetical protein
MPRPIWISQPLITKSQATFQRCGSRPRRRAPWRRPVCSSSCARTNFASSNDSAAAGLTKISFASSSTAATVMPMRWQTSGSSMILNVAASAPRSG